MIITQITWETRLWCDFSDEWRLVITILNKNLKIEFLHIYFFNLVILKQKNPWLLEITTHELEEKLISVIQY